MIGSISGSGEGCNTFDQEIDKAKAKFREAIAETQINYEHFKIQRGVITSLQELDSVLEEQKVLHENVKETEKQLKVFNETIEVLKTRLKRGDKEAAEAIPREIRRLVPSKGRCLPFYAYRPELLSTIIENPVCIVIGQTGSGKSTQLIQYLMEYCGFRGQIVCCQPRKLAATSLASRVAEEWCGPGESGTVGNIVGYKVGAAQRETPGVTRMKFVTNGVLLNEAMEDPLLLAYSAVIVDEAHERRIDTDILLCMLKRALRERTGDFRLIITSATLNDKLMSEYFDSCPVVRIPGRTFPVEVHYQEQEADFVDAAWRKAAEIHRKNAVDGHILVFLTGQEEIEIAIQKFKSSVKGNDIIVYPLHGKLPPEEANKVFLPLDPKIRKVIFATNQAETSITIDKVRYIIDTGMVKTASYDSSRGMQVLSLSMINRSLAEQRKGRAGRTGPGVCFRLYSKEDFEEMEESETAQILRSHLGMCILQLKLLGIRDVEKFEFVERPPDIAMKRAFVTLEGLGCLNNDGSLTQSGRITALMEMEPMLCRLVLEGCRLGVGQDCLTVASMMSVGGNIFYRGGSKDQQSEADQVKAANCIAGGDFCTSLQTFRKWEAEAGPGSGRSKEQQRAWCVEHFVNGKTMSSAFKAREELRVKLERAGVLISESLVTNEVLLRKAIAEGFFMNIAISNGPGKAGYTAIQLKQACTIHPGSSMVSLQEIPKYVVFQELAQTTRLFMRGVTAVDIVWMQDARPKFVEALDLETFRNNSYASFTFRNVSKSVCSLIVGRRGITLTAIEARLGCIIEPVPEESKVQVWAKEADLEQVKSQVEAILRDFDAKLESETQEVPVAGCTRIVLGSGAVSQEVLFSSEFRKVFVSNVYDWDWLVDHLKNAPFTGFVDESCLGVSSDHSNKWGVVLFARKEDSALAKSILDGYIAGGLALSVRPCVTHSTGIQMSRDTSLRILWTIGIPTGAATVYFGDADLAEKAAEVMHGRLMRGSTITCQFKRPEGSLVELEVSFNEKTGLLVGSKGVNLKRILEVSGIVVCNMSKEIPGKISFRGGLEATQRALRMVQEVDSLAQGRFLEQPKTGNLKDAQISWLPSVKITGLSKEIDEDILLSQFVKYGATGGVSARIQRKARAEPMGTGVEIFDDTLARLRSMLAVAAEGLGELEDLQALPPSRDSGRGKAFATFSSPGCVSKAIDMFNGKSGTEYNLGDGILRVKPNHSCVIALPEGLASALKDDLNNTLLTIREAAKNQVKAAFVDKGSKGCTISISGDTAAPVMAARMMLDPILTGDRFSCGEDSSAVARLCNPIGLKQMEKISASIPHCYIQWDRRTNQILIFGKQEQRAAARAALEKYVEETGRDGSWVCLLPPGGVRALVGADGRNVDRILKASECREVALNIRAQSVTCVGAPPALERAQNLVLESLASLPPAACRHSDGGPVGGGACCGVCLCDVEDGEASATLLCGHIFHRVCISAQIVDLTKSTGAPLPARCVHDGCGRHLALRDLNQICTPDTMAQLCRRSFRVLCEARAGELRPCPTPDCPQVVRRDHPGQWQCDCCLRRFCIACTEALDVAVEVHEDVGCQAYRTHRQAASDPEAAVKALLLEDLKEGIVRKCPNCGLVQGKASGCNHVTCSGCGAHWCWACASFHAKTGEPVYAHQNECEGYRFAG